MSHVPLTDLHVAGPPAVPAGSAGQAVLVVMTGREPVAHLQFAAALVAEMNRHLLVAIATPQGGVTTDTAVAKRAADSTGQEFARMAAVAQRVLSGCAVTYAIEPLGYRDSTFPGRRDQLIAAAAGKFARQRNAMLLSGWAVSGHPVRPGMPPDPVLAGRPAPMVAVVPDSVDAVCVVSAAGHLAVTTGCPLVLVIATNCPMLDHEEGAGGLIRIVSETAAVAGRVQPVLDKLGVRALALPALYRADPRPAVAAQRMVAAVQALASQLTARAVVATAGSVVATGVDLPGGTVYRVHPCTRGSEMNAISDPLRSLSRAVDGDRRLDDTRCAAMGLAAQRNPPAG